MNNDVLLPFKVHIILQDFNFQPCMKYLNSIIIHCHTWIDE